MTSGLVMLVHDSVTPKTTPTAAPMTRGRMSDHRLDQEADGDRGGEERGGGDDAARRGHRGAAQPVARCTAACGPGAEADEHAAAEQQDADEDARRAVERVGQPAVAVEV